LLIFLFCTWITVLLSLLSLSGDSEPLDKIDSGHVEREQDPSIVKDTG
jgi:hypothetical protein